jgi:chemotaxis protein MotB
MTLCLAPAVLWPRDLIDRPVPVSDVMKEMRTLSRMIEDLLEGKVHGMDVNPTNLRFSLSEKVLFHPGTDEFVAESLKDLDMLGELLKSFKGYVVIEGHTDDTPLKSSRFRGNWELSFARAMAIHSYFVQKHGMDENRLIPVAAGSRRPLAPNDTIDNRAKNRRVDFKLSYENVLTD